MVDLLESHVRETDAFTFRMERDPLLRSTIVAVAVFDRAPAWDSLVDRVDRATRLCPTFRDRLVGSPFGLAPPRWVVDPDFDLSWHLRRVAAPAPRTIEVVLGMARIAGMGAFDPARPLWEFTLVEGLERRRAALIMKVHHALTDGLGGIQLAAHVVDLQRQPADPGPMPPAPVPGPDGIRERYQEVLGFETARWLQAGRSAALAVPGGVVRAALHPAVTASTAWATASSLARFLRPVTTTLSPVMTGRRLQWRYDAVDVPLDGLKHAARVAEGTVNDAFLGAVTGGLRRYHEQHGSSVRGLHVTMPISLRLPGDPAGGNRITVVRFEVPVDLADPAARMRRIGVLCSDLRTEPALAYSEAAAGALNLLPVAITAGMLKHVDFLASNVPGFAAPVYVGGARVDRFYAFGPTLGSAANITLMSYRATCNVGITTDAAAVPDPDVFVDCLVDGFDEVLALAGAAGAARVRTAPSPSPV